MMTVKEKSKRKKREKTGKHHSAESGKYTSKEYAKSNPDKVVAETRSVEEKPAQENTQ